MPTKEIIQQINSYLIKLFLSPREKNKPLPQLPKRFLIIRQHNQFGDMLASVSLFRAIKEKYPDSKITLIASPQNYRGIVNNPFIDELFVFDKSKVFQKQYLKTFLKILKQNFDYAIVPATVAISSTSCIMAAISDAAYKIGPKSLEGKNNYLADLFHKSIELSWKKHPDSHVSDFILDIVRPLGISTKNFSSVIPISINDYNYADDFIIKIRESKAQKIIGMHIGAAKPQNKWSLDYYLNLIRALKENYDCIIYFTCGNADKAELDFMKEKYPETINYVNETIPQLAAMIDRSDLFITNDTGVMHVAGTTSTPQISLFGQTNPFNWAPIGTAKYFIRKLELINDIQVEDVFNMVKYIFEKHSK